MAATVFAGYCSANGRLYRFAGARRARCSAPTSRAASFASMRITPDDERVSGLQSRVAPERLGMTEWSIACAVMKRRGDVPARVEESPDVDDVIAPYVGHQIWMTADRQRSEAREAKLDRMEVRRVVVNEVVPTGVGDRPHTVDDNHVRNVEEKGKNRCTTRSCQSLDGAQVNELVDLIRPAIVYRGGGQPFDDPVGAHCDCERCVDGGRTLAAV